MGKRIIMPGLDLVVARAARAYLEADKLLWDFSINFSAFNRFRLKAG
jgi:hypothetical protein